MSYSELKKLRNIGISAHIDSGKTTLTERILFYTNKIHAIHEVRGKDGVGATMDSMELEKERGITIASAATNVTWKDHVVNIIDTPGHVDFTIEVENALRVLDGAILVLCSVGGVQSQTITVDRQLKRYGVPNIAFVNKCDRQGGSPEKVCDQLNEKLGRNAIMMQYPIGEGDFFQGVIDLVEMKAVYFEGENGENIVHKEIPSELLEKAEEKREIMLDAISMFCDDLAEAYLEGAETPEMIHKAVRAGTLALELTPVYMGTAYKNKGVQLLLDAVIDFLPCPEDIKNTGYDLNDEENEIVIKADPEKDAIALAFKLENQTYGQLTYIRIYQGTLKKGDTLYNMRTKNKLKVGRLIRMHAEDMEEIAEAKAGDIVALFGVDCALGDSFCGGDTRVSMQSMFVPEPIISLAITPKDNKSQNNMNKALNRFVKEDPTFKTYYDEETDETIIRGMGELHLDVYIERMKREYNVELEVGQPQVSYRETITKPIDFNYTHKKQSGGRGQYARVQGTIMPSDGDENKFVDQIKGGVIPVNFIPSCERGFHHSLNKGSLIEANVVGVEMVLNDGNFHPVDSSQIAFEIATIMAMRENYNKAAPCILEPLMKVSVETPSEFRGNVLGSVSQRRGLVTDTTVDDTFTRIDAEIPLTEIFGYATILRSLTQGKAEFTMEFSRYAKVPNSISEDIIKEKQEMKKKK